MNVELVISGVQEDQIFNKTINKHPIHANLVDGQLYLEDNCKKAFENYLIYELVKEGKGI